MQQLTVSMASAFYKAELDKGYMILSTTYCMYVI